MQVKQLEHIYMKLGHRAPCVSKVAEFVPPSLDVNLRRVFPDAGEAAGTHVQEARGRPLGQFLLILYNFQA